ncbi:MAG: hypothetical protein A2Y88_07425 [Chloroflexi bacterium RBG_13_48_10]|nr:MAG: hypothetical protein A2Y88_07425 [Chloroflexi bacterium RBG_13_48_10]
MKFDPHIHHRHSIRLKDYDYSQPGAYFITLVSYQRDCLFGNVIEGEMQLSRYGKIVLQVMQNLPDHYQYVTVEAFVVMPNHIHAIMVLRADDDDSMSRGGSLQDPNSSQVNDPSEWIAVPGYGQTRPFYRMRRHVLPEIVRALKSFSARRINQVRGTHGIAVWKRNYYEHIIRNQKELIAFREYIVDNSRRWTEDKVYHAVG